MDASPTIPIACSLTAEDLQDREGAWRKLLATSLVEAQRVQGGLHLTVHRDSADSLRQLVALEQECCPWMQSLVEGPTVTFTASGDGETAILEMFAEVLDCRILLISGSLRTGSTNSATVRTAASLSVAGVSTVIFEGMGELPHFNPDDDIEALHPAVTHLRTRLAAADAVLFCTPEYAGALPGSFKNLLDWTVGGGTYDKSVAWINASAGSGAVDAHASLRTVLERTGTDIVDAACAHIPVTRQAVGTGGVIEEAVIRGRIEDVLAALAERVRERRAARVAQTVATTVV